MVGPAACLVPVENDPFRKSNVHRGTLSFPNTLATRTVFECPPVSGIQEQSVHLSRAAIEPRIYHPHGEISSTQVGIRIACVHIDRMGPKSEVRKKRAQSKADRR